MKEEKASDKLWRTKQVRLFDLEYALPDSDKQLYNQLLSLEAKIELTREVANDTNKTKYWAYLDTFEKQYNKLKEQHNL